MSWKSQKLSRLVSGVVVTAILGFLLLPALVVTLAAFNDRAICPSRPRHGRCDGS